MRPKGVVVRKSYRVATMGPRLRAKIVMIDPARGFLRVDISKVNPTDLFSRYYSLQGVASHARVVPV